MHSQQLNHWLLLPLNTYDKIAPSGFSFVDLYGCITSVLGEIFDYLVRASFECGSLLTRFDRHKISTPTRGSGRFLW